MSLPASLNELDSPSLTKAQYAELLSYYRELETAERVFEENKIVFFVPRGGQAQFHQDGNIPVRLVLGSNRSGKTTSGVLESIAHALGFRPWLDRDHPEYYVSDLTGQRIRTPNVGRIIAQNFHVSINQNIWPVFEEWLPKRYILDVKRDARQVVSWVRLTNGSIIYFMSAEQDDMVFEGTKGHWAWFDEPPPYAKYVAVKRGLVDFYGKCWLTMTPISQPWINDVIASKAGDPDSTVKVYKFDIWDQAESRGGNIPDVSINEFISTLREDEKEARLYGNFLHLAGRVFKEWRPEAPYWVKPFDLDPYWPRVCLIDPHPRKPVAVMWICVTPDNQFVIYRDLYSKDLLTVFDVGWEMRAMEGWLWRGSEASGFWQRTDTTENVVLYIIDTSANQMERTGGLTIKKKFAQPPHNIVCQDAYKVNREAGLDAIHERLKIRGDWQEPGIITFNTCQHVKRNWLFYSYDEWRTSKDRDLKDEKQEPRKKDDDYIDLLRYMCQKQLTYSMLKGMQPDMTMLPQRPNFNELPVPGRFNAYPGLPGRGGLVQPAHTHKGY